MGTFVLRKWSVVDKDGDDPYLAPELHRVCLAGWAHGPGSDESEAGAGRHVVTSPIQEVDGRRIQTRSGTTYLLEGPPEEGYARYLAESGLPPLDPAAPIKVIR